MLVKRNKVNYTETQITLTTDEVRDILAEHIKTTKKVDVQPKDIEFDIVTGPEPDDPVFDGVTVVVIKRGRVIQPAANGRARPAKPEKDPFEEAQEAKPLGAPSDGDVEVNNAEEEPAKPRKKTRKKVKKAAKAQDEAQDEEEPAKPRKKKSAEDWGPLRPRF